VIASEVDAASRASRPDRGSLVIGTVSIVVPTRNRPSALRRCLGALSGQRGVGTVEIVVVDDGSTDADRVSAVVASQPLARLIRTGGAGPAAARNAGAAAAIGTYLCFTDDDCAPDAEWAVRLVRSLEAGADVVGGATVNGRAGDPFVETSELIVRELQASTQRRLGGRVFIPSNNFACRRTVVLAHPFDERYSMAGGEDRAWCASVAGAGLTLTLEPSAVVAHRPLLDLGGFWRQHVRYGRGAYHFARTTGRDWQEPPEFYIGLLRSGIRTGIRCLLLVLLAQVATGVGFASEVAQARKR
jgi:glycosyltransferase involved in cell wall biosynthesis